MHTFAAKYHIVFREIRVFMVQATVEFQMTLKQQIGRRKHVKNLQSIEKAILTNNLHFL